MGYGALGLCSELEGPRVCLKGIRGLESRPQVPAHHTARVALASCSPSYGDLALYPLTPGWVRNTQDVQM